MSTKAERHAAAIARIEAYWSTAPGNRKLIQACAHLDSVRGWVFSLLFDEGAPERGVLDGADPRSDLARVMASHGCKVATAAIMDCAFSPVQAIEWRRTR